MTMVHAVLLGGYSPPYVLGVAECVICRIWLGGLWFLCEPHRVILALLAMHQLIIRLAHRSDRSLYSSSSSWLS